VRVDHALPPSPPAVRSHRPLARHSLCNIRLLLRCCGSEMKGTRRRQSSRRRLGGHRLDEYPAKIAGYFCRIPDNHRIVKISQDIRRNRISGTSLLLSAQKFYFIGRLFGKRQKTVFGVLNSMLRLLRTRNYRKLKHYLINCCPHIQTRRINQNKQQNDTNKLNIREQFFINRTTASATA
jgi:hypothetical protein